MKTVEEKAREYSNSKGIYNEHGERLLYMGYLAGYKEVTRWRDPNIEPPEVGMKVLVKTSNGKYSVTEMYVRKDSIGTTHGAEWRGSYNFRMSVIGWRPIE